MAGDGEYTPAGGLIRNPWGASIRIHCDALSMERLPARETGSRSWGAAFRVFAFIGPLLDRLSAMPPLGCRCWFPVLSGSSKGAASTSLSQ